MSSVTDEIKARVDLVELIGRTVRLKRVGAQFSGLCPFHVEKTPSFYVRPQTQSWHCFGCNKSGTAFDWLMEREHVDFGEALRSLATMTGVVLPEHRDPEADEQTRRLYSILERAQTYYQGLLWGSTGGPARTYVQTRGLDDETLKSFGLGYASAGNGLLRYLERDGFAEQELQAAGVIGMTEDGRQFDFFRDRLLFPIRDGQGRPIAFGGRALDDEAKPKYLNSRDTLLFHKHETLFAFDLARKPIAQERQAVIVEGYMDAAMAHQHGYRNVVATLGTAVTERHLRLLRRQVDEIVLALDADAAGQAATWRALQVADESLRTGLTPVVGPNRRQQRFVSDRSVRLRVLALPGAKDPDELIRSDPHTWPALVQAALPVVDFVLQRLEVRHDLTTAQGKAAAADEIAEVLAGIANPIEQDSYTNDVAARLGVDPDAVRRLLKGRTRGRGVARPAGSPGTGEPATPGPLQVRGDALDDYMLALVIGLREVPMETATETPIEPEFILSESWAVYRALGGDVPPELEPYLLRAQKYVPDVSRLATRDLLRELDETRLRIKQRLLKQQIERIHSLGDDDEVRRLTGQLIELAQGMGAIDQQLPPKAGAA
ncbi:MAG: DNA primase [Chloroflexi bacterium]|nr:DNA primase [Chloroflexota bacterium]